jgi:hypothetical protein
VVQHVYQPLKHREPAFILARAYGAGTAGSTDQVGEEEKPAVKTAELGGFNLDSKPANGRPLSLLIVDQLLE